MAEVPEGVEVKVDGKTVFVKGEKGELERTFSDARFNKSVDVRIEDKNFIAEGKIDDRKIKAFVGTIAAHVRNMILGVTKGFKCELAVVFTHFPMTFTVEPKKFLINNFIGEKGSRSAKIIGNVEIKADKTKITITGINKEDVGQTASNIEHICGVGKKDRRTFQDGCFIVASGVDDETFVNEFDNVAPVGQQKEGE
ncbi:50S ribosomal protein L6 [archaeon]|nr:50S ribosomal protein L6 [archaeon]